MKPTAARHAVRWLEREPGFARLGEQAARLVELQAELTRQAPTLALTVIALERDQLVVGAPHAAVAARLRQMEPSLVAALARRGWRIERIRFKPQWRPVPGPPPRAAKSAPGAAAIAEIRALSERVDDPRLRAALRRLAARHAPPAGESDR